MKKFLKTLLTLFLTLILLGGIGFFAGREWYLKQISTPNSTSDESIRFEITPGQGADVIAANLKSKNLVKNADVFYWYVRLNKITPKIQAGTFFLERNMTVIQIAEAIQKASEDTIWVTVPEGLRMDEVGDIVEEKFKNIEEARFSRKEFDEIVQSPGKFTFTNETQAFLNKVKPQEKPLEGFLYPDTYNFERNATTIKIIEKMIVTLEGKLTKEDVAKIEGSSLSYYETLIMASLIERETFNDSEKADVADILLKRLDGKLDGTKTLNVDASLLYEAKDWKANAFLLKNKDSAYNTYKLGGLPPTPIANPAVSSIKAVIYPRANEYFFYLHDDRAKIHYAKTLDEHNKNKQKYIDN